MLKYEREILAFFVCALVDYDVVANALQVALGEFNQIERKLGQRKFLGIGLNTLLGALDITMHYEKEINPRYALSSLQKFSEILAKQPGMEKYLVNGRLLETRG